MRPADSTRPDLEDCPQGEGVAPGPLPTPEPARPRPMLTHCEQLATCQNPTWKACLEASGLQGSRN